MNAENLLRNVRNPDLRSFGIENILSTRNAGVDKIFRDLYLRTSKFREVDLTNPEDPELALMRKRQENDTIDTVAIFDWIIDNCNMKRGAETDTLLTWNAPQE